jgi:hypothetical protein
MMCNVIQGAVDRVARFAPVIFAPKITVGACPCQNGSPSP